VGIDGKYIKQYIYNAQHIENAKKKKFSRVKEFIKAIPKLDRSIKKHSKLNNYDKNKVITTILKIVKKLHIRVGKEIYVKRNKSYGVSSLRKRHVTVNKNNIRLKFKSKSNKNVSYTITDSKIIADIEILLKLDGEKLFQYVNDSGKTIGIRSKDINDYIKRYMGKMFTVKDFRSYAANYYFVKSLMKEHSSRSPKNKKAIAKNIKNAIDKTAFQLRHTKAISKKSYILNFAIEMYQENPAYLDKFSGKKIDDVLITILKDYEAKQNIK
jgi:DNA topoisomerase-1